MHSRSPCGITSDADNAMSMTQFLPSEYYKHAVRFDGDGRSPDIWHSVPDALASAAKQLADKSGLDERRVRAIIAGRWTPSPAERDRIAAAFGVSREQIAWGHVNPIAHVYGHGPQFGRSP